MGSANPNRAGGGGLLGDGRSPTRASVEDAARVTLASADGYLHKGVSGVELLEAVRHAHADVRVWLLAVENEEEAAAWVKDASGRARLTPKEKEVFALVLKLGTNTEIPRGDLHQPVHPKEPRLQHPA